MSRFDVLDDIISSLSPNEIRPEFVLYARITDLSGNETEVTREEFAHYLSNPWPVHDIKVALNEIAMKRAIINEVDSVYREVNRLIMKSRI